MPRVIRPLTAVALSFVIVASSAVVAHAEEATYDTTTASSYTVLVNKQNPLSPKTYAPKDLVTVPVAHVYPVQLRKRAAKKLVAMFAAFHAQTGKTMQSQSAYRSYSAQVTTYNGWVARLGQTGADLTSARPGFSEHQTGLAIDISAAGSSCALKACFATTKQGRWLAAHAWEYGFVLRYPKGETQVTGYEFEPWHYRFVTKPVAAAYRSSGASTLEEFLGYPDATDYR